MMNNNDEYWDLFDINRTYVGQTHRRGDIIPDGLFHLVVHSWVMDREGNFLISQRQRGRSNEYKWERTGGSVLAGETSLEGALRELHEELGIVLTGDSAIFIKSERRDLYHDYFDSWLFIVDRESTPVIIDFQEVCDCRWVTLDILEAMKAKNLLVKSSEYFNEVYKIFLEKQHSLH